jgi:hypothetical protein
VFGPGLVNTLGAEIHLQVMEGDRVVETAVHAQRAPGS